MIDRIPAPPPVTDSAGPSREECLEALRTLDRLVRQALMGEADREALWAFVKEWLPAAEARRDTTASPSDRVRWVWLIGAVHKALSGSAKPDRVGLGMAARVLLRALRESALPGPCVQEIADHVRAGIGGGAYHPGSPLWIKRIAAEVGCPPASFGRVEVALRDLAAEGLVTITKHSARVALPRSLGPDDTLRVAGWLRRLVTEGAFPPGSQLPPPLALSRSLVCSRRTLTQALAILQEQGIVARRPGKPARVLAKLPMPVTEPGLDALLPQVQKLRRRGGAPDPAELRAFCQQVRRWQRMRSHPGIGTLENARKKLIDAAARLVLAAARRQPDDPCVHNTLRQAAVTVTVLARTSQGTGEDIWQNALLAVTVIDLLALVSEVFSPA